MPPKWTRTFHHPFLGGSFAHQQVPTHCAHCGFGAAAADCSERVVALPLRGQFGGTYRASCRQSRYLYVYFVAIAVVPAGRGFYSDSCAKNIRIHSQPEIPV